MAYEPYLPNSDSYKLQKIMENTQNNGLAGNSGLAGIAQVGAINGLSSSLDALADSMESVANATYEAAEINLQTEIVRHRNTMEEIVTQHDANISEMHAKANLSDQQIRDALGTESSEGGYLNQLIEIADGAGATIVTSTGSTLSIGPKRRKD
jgi:hypothetical protein